MAPQSDQARFPQLDGLRAFAVLGVFISHFGAGTRLVWVQELLDWGHLGVRLFFVLSGFLITRILLKSKDAVESGRMSLRRSMLNFYGRRFIRIFPIFYLTLILAGILDVQGIRSVLHYHFFYLSNLTGAIFQVTEGGQYILKNPVSAHFWSLAVEEQFYLLWPITLMLVPKKHMVKVVILGISAAFVWRILWLAFVSDLPSQSVLACVDTLGAGALLAIYEKQWLPLRFTWRSKGGILLAAGIALLAGITGLKALGIAYRPRMLLLDAAEAVVFFFVVAFAASGSSGRAGTLLSSRVLRYLGKISYGMYVYHAFMSPLQIWLFERLGLPPIGDTLGRSVLLTGLTIAVASASWYVLEVPLNRLKDRIPGSSAQAIPGANSHSFEKG